MTLITLNPSGTDGADVTTSAPFTVVKSGAGVVQYEADYGMERGNLMGIRFAGSATADQGNILIANTAAIWAALQAYVVFEAWPVGGFQDFLGCRVAGAGANAARFVIGTAGAIALQNRAGSNVSTFGGLTLSLGTRYRFVLEQTPGSSTSTGEVYARVYDDNDTLLATEVHLTGQNLGGDISNSIGTARVGDSSTATISTFAMGATQVGFDTGSTRPTIPAVPKLVVPESVYAEGLNALSWQQEGGVWGWY